MEDTDLYDGMKVVWKGRKGFVIDSFRAQDGTLMAIVSVSPSSTGIGNNVPARELEEADE